MITAESMIAAFQGYLAADDGYIPNTSGEVWTQEKQAKATAETVQKYGARWIGHHVEDCSGAFVRAYKAAGLSIYHGSNRIAREYVAQLLPIDQARPGMAALKAREPGERYYALSVEYKPGGAHYNGDLKDYYHIGLVDTNPAYVINAASTQSGVIRSKITNGWDCVAWLKAVEHGGEEDMADGSVRVVNANKVNLRAMPAENAARVEYLNKGDEVQCLAKYDSKWDYVAHGSKKGYVMDQFLSPAGDENAPAEPATAGGFSELIQWLYQAMAANEQERAALEAMQAILTGAAG